MLESVAPTVEPPPPPPPPKSVLSRALHRLAGHFTALRPRSDAWFFWWITLEGLLLAVALAIAADYFFKLPDDHSLDDLSTTQLFLLVCVAAPLYETVLQIVPGELMRRWRARFWVQVGVVTVPFAAVHFTNDAWSGLFAGVIGGFYLALIYVHFREKSWLRAALLTAASHAFQNSVVIITYVTGIWRPGSVE